MLQKFLAKPLPTQPPLLRTDCMMASNFPHGRTAQTATPVGMMPTLLLVLVLVPCALLLLAILLLRCRWAIVWPLFERLIDSSSVSQMVFAPPTRVRRGECELGADEMDGVVDVGTAALAYRLFHGCPNPKFLVLFFHANNWDCTQVRQLFPFFAERQCAVFACSFRGYAWSTDTPRLSTLCADTEIVVDKLAFILGHVDAISERAALADLPVLAWGHSLGASCAVHAAIHRPQMIRGLLLYQGLQTLTDLPVIGQFVPADWKTAPILKSLIMWALRILPEPLDTLHKMVRVGCPVSLVHGTKDTLVPFEQALRAYKRCPSTWKRLNALDDADHHNIGEFHSLDDLGRWFDELVEAASAVPQADRSIQ